MNQMKEVNYANDPYLKIWQNNITKNIEERLFTKTEVRPFNFLMNTKTFSGLPIVCVGAGPSLDRNIQVLKDNQSKVIILCADIVLFKLIEYGITPDFVVSVDPSEIIHKYWTGVDTFDLCLITSTTTNPSTLRFWKGNVFLFNQTSFHKEKAKLMERITFPTRGFLSFENTGFVGGTMYQIACKFRPNPVILIGYDLCYTDNKYYCDGIIEKRMSFDNVITQEHFDNIINTPTLVAEIGNKQYKCSDSFAYYRKSMIELVKKLKEPCINATEDGILNELPKMTLRGAISKFGQDIKRPLEFQIKRKRRRK